MITDQHPFDLESGPQGGVSLRQGVLALEDAVSRSRGRIPPEVTSSAQDLLAKIEGRRTIDMATTVAAFAGATGSGKSSLLNAVVGLDLARVAPTRPTTSRALGVSGIGPTSEALNWLSVPDRSVLSPPHWLAEQDLILIDLPDIDSTARENREIAAALISRADVVVWVVDPQKYADGVLHREFLSRLREQATGMIVVLNHVDALAAGEVAGVVAHLEHLLAETGFAAPVVPTSALTGEGVDKLRDQLVALAVGKHAAARRLAGDVRAEATLLGAAAQPGKRLASADSVLPGAPSRRRDSAWRPDPFQRPGSGQTSGDVSGVGRLEPTLVRELGDTLGAATVERAAAQSYRHRGLMAVGWPWTRWVRSMRVDPLKRLHLSARGDVRAGVDPEAGGAGGIPSIVRTPAQVSSARRAVRRFADTATQGLPSQWRRPIIAQAEDTVPALVDSGDEVITRMQSRYARHPKWWVAAGSLQWCLAAAAVAGLLWLAVYWVADFLKVLVPGPPYWGPIAVPTALIAGGLLLGWLLSLLSRLFLARGAQRTSLRVRADLDAGLQSAVHEVVVAPVEREIAGFAAFQEDLAVMAGVTA